MAASRCARCGDVQADIDVGFSLAAQKMVHAGCGGTYRRYQPGPVDAYGRDSLEVARAQKWARGLDADELRIEVADLARRAEEHGIHGYDAIRLEMGRAEARKRPAITGLDGDWIRIVWDNGDPILEMRDPNHGCGRIDDAPRHQYRVEHGILRTRRLPPESAGTDAWRDIGVPPWAQYDLPPSAMPDGPVRDFYEWRRGQ